MKGNGWHTIIVTQGAPWERVVGSRRNIAFTEAKDTEGISDIDVVGQRAGVPVVREREQNVNSMLLGELQDLVEPLQSGGAIVDDGCSVLDQLEPSAVFRDGVNI